MTIKWTGTIKIKNKDGSERDVTYMANVNNNTNLHAVGETYGVKKLSTDAPHWSHNGRWYNAHPHHYSHDLQCSYRLRFI